ncbi:hypothetical protein ACFXOD_35190 [Streptomyces sp. NPDC059161]|uniref:hypothetical protein n=1 Tax=Streptomyces sp. NPDC059161 TaxID=3346749 RepID=UPI00367FAEEC
MPDLIRKSTSGRHRTLASGAVLVLTAITLTAGCSSVHTEGKRPASSLPSSALPSTGGSSSPSPSVSIAAPPSAPPLPSAVKSSAQAADRAAGERAAAAPKGGTPVRHPAPGQTAVGDENFGKASVVDGDITVYTPVRQGSALTLPVKITNSGGRRAFYQADVRVQGSGGFDVTVHIDTDVVGLYPGTSWPTELTAQVPGKSAPDHPTVTIEHVIKREVAG